MSGARVIKGDVLEKFKFIPDESIDLICTDPPYNIGVDYGFGKHEDKRKDYPEWCAEWIQQCSRVLSAKGSIWIVSGQEFGAHIDLEMQKYFFIRNRITWYESFGAYCRNKFGRTSRPIFYGTKKKLGFTFNRSAVTVPSDRQLKYNDKRANPEGKVMGDVWDIARVCGTFKERIPGVPTQLPKALVTRIVKVSSNRGDTVLDPFCGSGTVLAVSKSLGRDSLGIEQNPEYVRIAEDRIEKEG